MGTVARLRDDRQRVVYPLSKLLSFPEMFKARHSGKRHSCRFIWFGCHAEATNQHLFVIGSLGGLENNHPYLRNSETPRSESKFRLAKMIAIHPAQGYGGQASVTLTIWATRTLPLPSCEAKDMRRTGRDKRGLNLFDLVRRLDPICPTLNCEARVSLPRYSDRTLREEMKRQTRDMQHATRAVTFRLSDTRQSPFLIEST